MKPTMKHGALAVVAAAFLGLLVFSGWIDATAASENRDRENAAVIGHLQMRDTYITVYGGKLGTYYTVQTKNGEILADRITKRELRHSFSELHDRIEGGMAGNWAMR